MTRFFHFPPLQPWRLACLASLTEPGHAQISQPANSKLAFDIYKELVEINTVTQTGDTGRAGRRQWRARLLAAGFDAADVQVFKPAPRKGQSGGPPRGTGARRPILLLAHLDVGGGEARGLVVRSVSS